METIPERKMWEISSRFARSLDAIHFNRGTRNRAVDGFYPTWMERSEYHRFLDMITMWRSCNMAPSDPLSDRLKDSERIKEIEGRLDWCEQTTKDDVKRHVRNLLKDRYHAW